MDEEDKNCEWWASVPSSVKLVVLTAVIGGGFGNYSTIAKTDDRFRGADFAREIAARDARIRELEATQQAHLRHSAQWTEVIKTNRKEIERLNSVIFDHEQRIYDE